MEKSVKPFFKKTDRWYLKKKRKINRRESISSKFGCIRWWCGRRSRCWMWASMALSFKHCKHTQNNAVYQKYSCLNI